MPNPFTHPPHIATFRVLAPAVIGVVLSLSVRLPAAALVGVILSALLAWLASGGGRVGWRELGFTTPVAWRRVLAFGLGGAVVVHLLFAAFLPVVARIFGPPDLSAFASIEGRPDRLALMLVIALVNGALAEEILFRGFLQGRLERRFAPRSPSTLIPLVLTSLLFGAGHYYQGWTGVIGTFLAGLVFGGVRLLDRRRLWGAAAAHGIYDWSALIMVYLAGFPGS